MEELFSYLGNEVRRDGKVAREKEVTVRLQKVGTIYIPNVETENGQRPLPISKDTKLHAFRILMNNLNSNACPTVWF